jgi:hypothetical protein
MLGLVRDVVLVLIALISNAVTLLVTRRNAATTERVAHEQAAVAIQAEQARHDSEMARLGREHLQADRQVRRDAYANWLTAIERFDTFTSDYTPPPTREALAEWLATFRRTMVHVRLVESPAVKAARRQMDNVFNALQPKIEAALDAGAPMEDALGYPYVEMRPQFSQAGRALGDAMHDDLAYAAHASDA